MKSDRGEIEVFLCPEEDGLQAGAGLSSEESANDDTDSEATINSPVKIKREIPYQDSAIMSAQPSMGQMGGSPPGSTWEAPSRNGTEADSNQAIKNVLIWESEDFGPIGNRFQQQTVDQDHHGTINAAFFIRVLFRFLPVQVDGTVAQWFIVDD